MTITNDIRGCLDNHLANTSGLPVIVPQNIEYIRQPGTSYIKSNFNVTSIRPAVRGLNPQKRYQGLYTMLICTPSDIGPGDALDYADILLDRFKPTSDLTFGSTIVSLEFSQLGNSFSDSPFYCLPVIVDWYIYNL
jgi:hypothetical protein